MQESDQNNQLPQSQQAAPQVVAMPDVSNTESPNTDMQPNLDTQLNDNPLVSWVAAEFIGHEKNAQWFIGLGVVSVIIIAAVFFITRDITSVIVLGLGAVVLGVVAGRSPKEQQYNIYFNGFSIGAKRYTFGQFRSFSVVEEGGMLSAMFIPLKRFAPMTTIYFPPQLEEEVLAILDQSLPYQEYRHDSIDRLMKRVRF